MLTTPHPHSRASLLALQDTLRREERARMQVMALIPIKVEFLDMQFAHRLRAKGIPIRQFYGAVKKTRLKPWYSVHAPRSW